MVKSPLSDLTGDNGAKQREKESKKKDKKFKNSFNNAFLKELAPFIIWSSITLTTVGGTAYYTNVHKADEYALGNFSKLSLFSGLEEKVNSSAEQVGATQAELENETNKVRELTADLSEQGKVKSPLSQGYYFISYLSYLSEKYEVNLKKLDVLASDGQSEIDLTKEENLQGSFDLLPIKVKLTASSENLKRVFEEIYTKRIILVKDLNIDNHLDGTVTAEFRIFFRDVSFQTDDYGQVVTDPGTGAPVLQEVGGEAPPTGEVPTVDPLTGEPLNVNVNEGGDNSNGEPVIDPITGTTIQ